LDGWGRGKIRDVREKENSLSWTEGQRGGRGGRFGVGGKGKKVSESSLTRRRR